MSSYGWPADQPVHRQYQNRVSQRVTLKCPRGHRLGTYTAVTDTATVSWEAQKHQGRPTPTVRLQSGELGYVCQKCQHVEHTAAASFPDLSQVLELLAAMLCYGPATGHVTVPAATHDLMSKTADLSGADQFAESRLEYLDRLRGGRR